MAETETLTVEDIDRLQSKSRRGGGIYRADMDALFDLARRAVTEIPRLEKGLGTAVKVGVDLQGELATATAQVEQLREALEGIVKVIETAGLQNLSNGVQLGATAWFVKAEDAVNYAKSTLAAK